MSNIEQRLKEIEALIDFDREALPGSLSQRDEHLMFAFALVRRYREVLEVQCVASCTCLTKSGDPEVHAESCRYKQLRAALAYNPEESK